MFERSSLPLSTLGRAPVIPQGVQTDSDTLSPVFRTSRNNLPTSRGALSSLSAPTAQRASNSPAVESAPAGAFYSPIVAVDPSLSSDDAAASVPNPDAAATYYAMVAERDALAAKLSRVGAAGSRGIVKQRKRLQALTHALMQMEVAR